MDDQLTSALRSLPRTAAGSGFTDAVWRRLEERRDRGPRRLGRWPLRAAVAAACLSLLVLGTREWWHHRELQRTVARLTALETERRALVAELESLDRQLSTARQVVYLSGNNDLDLVLDLAQLQRLGFEPGDFRAERLRALQPRAAASRPPGPAPARFEPAPRPTIY